MLLPFYGFCYLWVPTGQTKTVSKSLDLQYVGTKCNGRPLGRPLLSVPEEESSFYSASRRLSLSLVS